MTGILRFHTESSQGIRHDVGGGCQVFTGSRRQVHNAFNTGNHIPGLPAGHRHVFKGRCRLRCGELGLGTHLTGFIPKALQVVPGRAGDSRHLGHTFIEVRSCLDSRRA